ncbi:MAG: PrsW family intramembrane metalloprotease [Clostridiales bacterium]|nr:PrsW family intramembrane metalloprotease [Clostridiales bacterium]
MLNNIMLLLPMGIAPAVAGLFYIYIRDKYEKEPIRLLAIGVLFGVVLTAPIIKTEEIVHRIIPPYEGLSGAFFSAFFAAALVEEGLKFAVLYFLTWRNKNFNERFDGIVYSVFISLGFAGCENILYVLSPTMGGFSTALSRAAVSVPSHGFFGVTMGYYFALAKFENHDNFSFIIKAFVWAFLIHGTFDFILISGYEYYMIIFIPFLCIFWLNGFRKMKKHIELSPFKKVALKT